MKNFSSSETGAAGVRDAGAVVPAFTDNPPQRSASPKTNLCVKDRNVIELGVINVVVRVIINYIIFKYNATLWILS